MAKTIKPLVQVKSFFEPQKEIDVNISTFLISQKLKKEDFEAEWTIHEWEGEAYCLVVIYYVAGADLANKNPV